MNIIYHSFSAGLISGFFEQLLFFGIFVIALAMIRRAALTPDWLKSSDFIKHLILVFSVSIFTSYIYITYGIESVKGLADVGASLLSTEKESLLNSLEGDKKTMATVQLLLMLPIDLVGMALVASLFGTIAVMHLRAQAWSSSNLLTIKTSQYLIAILLFWHFTMIVWWVMYAITNGQIPFFTFFSDIKIHLIYMVLELIFYYLFVKASKTTVERDNSEKLAWIGVLAVAVIFISLYVVRLLAYTDKFINNLT